MYEVKFYYRFYDTRNFYKTRHRTALRLIFLFHDKKINHGEVYFFINYLDLIGELIRCEEFPLDRHHYKIIVNNDFPIEKLMEEMEAYEKNPFPFLSPSLN